MPNNSNQTLLDTFGQFLMSTCRDRAIDDFEQLATGQWKAPELQELQTQLQEFDKQELHVIRQCVIHVIDAALHDLLFAVQEHKQDELVQILVEGQDITELSDGLHGDLFTWIDKFSRNATEQE